MGVQKLSIFWKRYIASAIIEICVFRDFVCLFSNVTIFVRNIVVIVMFTLETRKQQKFL